MITKKEVLWSVDCKYNEFEGEIQDPLYTIVKDDNNYYHVKYYGACGVYLAESLDNAKAWIRKELEPAKAIRAQRARNKSNRKRKYQRLLEEMKEEQS